MTGVMHDGTTLNDAIRQWQTPDAGFSQSGHGQRGGSRSNGSQSGRDLKAQAQRWRTPDAGDSGNYIDPVTVQTGLDSRGMERTVDLSNQAEYWQTPRTPQGGNKLDPATVARKGMDEQGVKRTVDLSNQTECFRSSPQVLTILPGLTFCERVRIYRQLCRQLKRRLPSPYNKARSMFKRRLNPNFVDWLMGAPIGWSDADHAFNATEMESYLSRLRSHIRCLLGG